MKSFQLNISSLKVLVFLMCACLMCACDNKLEAQENAFLNVQPKDLQGTWTLSHNSVMDNPTIDLNNFAYGEWSPYGIESPTLNLRFVGDSVQVFSYPLEYYGTYAFELRENNRFIIDKASVGDSPWEKEAIHVSKDSLWRTCAIEAYLLTDHYFRDTLDEAKLAMLIRDSVDAAALQGIWRLDHIMHVEYDESYVIEFPFKLPETIDFSADDVRNIKDRIVTVKVNSVPRPFRVGFVSKYRIWLKPNGWYADWVPQIEYQKYYFISLLEDMGINNVEEIKRLEVEYASDLGTLVDNEAKDKTIKTTVDRTKIAQFTDLLSQLSHEGNGKEYRDRPDNVPAWRIRLVDQKDLWHIVLFIGNKIETPVGAPGEYYVDAQNVGLERDLYGLMKEFVFGGE